MLQQLNLQKFNNSALGEKGLQKLLQSCKKNLQYLGLPYSSQAIKIDILLTVSSMPKLTSLHLGLVEQNLNMSVDDSKLWVVK